MVDMELCAVLATPSAPDAPETVPAQRVIVHRTRHLGVLIVVGNAAVLVLLAMLFLLICSFGLQCSSKSIVTNFSVANSAATTTDMCNSCRITRAMDPDGSMVYLLVMYIRHKSKPP